MIDSAQLLATCPLGEGDRVDHAKFGLGTVSRVDGSPLQKPSEPAPAWKVEVIFDGGVGTKRVLNTFLVKVSSPEIRPFIFWDRQWQALRQVWLNARRSHEEALSKFRPPPKPEDIERLRTTENDALLTLHDFIASDDGRQST